MASLYLREYAFLNDSGVPVEPAVKDQKLTIGASSVQSTAFDPMTKFIVLNADNACSILIGTNPTATAANFRLASNTVNTPLAVQGGLILAVITNS